MTTPAPLFTRIHQIAQHCDDLERAVAFYRDTLGCRWLATFDPPGIAFVEVGGSRLMLERSASPALLYLEVDDVAAARTRLVGAGVVFEDEPHMIFRDTDGTFGAPASEEWMTFFRDSEGNLVALVERRPRELWRVE